MPCVIGWLRPIVLIPCSVLTELSPHYLESLLAHELAHVWAWHEHGLGIQDHGPEWKKHYNRLRVILGRAKVRK